MIMAVEYLHFLQWAETEIKLPELEEFSRRNAGSRAYYALYHAAVSKAEQLCLRVARVENGGSHEAIIQAIANFSQKGRVIAELMRKVKRFRHRCDYDINMPLPEHKARQQVAEAHRLIDMLQRL